MGHIDISRLYVALALAAKRGKESSTLAGDRRKHNSRKPSVGSVVPLRLTAQLLQKRIIPFLREHRTHLVQLPRDETQALATPAID